MIDNVNKKREKGLISWVLWVLRHLVWVLRCSYFSWGEESIGDVFVRSGYMLMNYISQIYMLGVALFSVMLKARGFLKTFTCHRHLERGHAQDL